MLHEQLKAHGDIRDTIGRLRAYLDRDTPPCDRDFARARWLLVRQVALHDRIEQGWFTALGPAVPSDARGDQSPDVAEQVISWGTSVQDACWDRYRGAALHLMTKMERQMAQEEAEFAALHTRAPFLRHQAHA